MAKKPKLSCENLIFDLLEMAEKHPEYKERIGEAFARWSGQHKVVQQPVPTVVQALTELEAKIRLLGCSDGGCCIKRPRGMHTNGGCRCLRLEHDDHEQIANLRQALYAYQAFHNAVRKEYI